jgi:formamidopyrimidine-DNA glycosylase
MRRDLERLLGRRRIVAAEVLDRKVVAGDPAALVRGLAGRRVREFGRLGKVLLLTLDDGGVLLLHPRMTGRLVALTPAQSLTAHARLVLSLSGGRRIVFDDTRRFGRVEYCPPGATEAQRLTCRLGPDALDCETAVVAVALRRRRVPLKAFLLDQTVVAGVGNIYASEILHHCGLHPLTPASTLRPAEVERLVVTTREVLAEGVAYRGTTIADYRTLKGEAGGYQHRLQVYGRAGQPCLREGCAGVIERSVIAGRSTFHCPRCQRTGCRRRATAR